MVANVVIIGSGPAGYTAAIYAARAQLEPIVFEGFQSGGIPGGQLMTTTDVENFPGFPAGIQGPVLMDRMRQQAQRWGARLITEDVIAVDLQERPFRVSTARQTLSCHSVIIATGATAKRLNLPSETIYWNRGISACAICDGASPLFRDRAVAVVGGGDTAAEESIFLTKYASHVHLLVRRDRLRASKTMQARLLSHPKITVHWHTETLDALGDQKTLQALSLRDTVSGETRELKVQGLFYAIGHTPNTEIFAGQLELDAAGYIQTNSQTMATAIAGVYAAGDVQDHEYRQAITAAGTGCAAALQAERYLSHHDLIQPPSRSPSDLEKAWLSDHAESTGEAAPELETSEDPDIFEFDLV